MPHPSLSSARSQLSSISQVKFRFCGGDGGGGDDKLGFYGGNIVPVVMAGRQLSVASRQSKYKVRIFSLAKMAAMAAMAAMAFCALKDCFAYPICHKAQSAEHAAKAAKAARLVW